MRKFNLSLDDYSPHPRAGLNHESISWCNRLIDKYPDICIDLFVPAAYCRLKEKPLRLSENLEWIKYVKGNVANRENYRIGMHGLYHRRVDGKNPDSNNDEFQFLKGKWPVNIINEMIAEFNRTGLKYDKTFRPPGWKISLDSVKVLTDMGFVIAGNKVYWDLLKGKIKDIKWISYNWDCVKKCDVYENIVAYAHTSSWTTNYMNEERFNLINSALEKEKFEFVFIRDLVK